MTTNGRLVAVPSSPVGVPRMGGLLFLLLLAAAGVLTLLSAPADAQSGCGASSQIPEAECAALLELYSVTNGPQWTESDGWLAAPDPCDWLGVTCTGNNVTRLVLEHNGMSGPIPPELANLTELTFLSLHVNSLTGPIPPEIGLLLKLEYLEFSGNDLSGQIPAELGNLPVLDHLDLSGNHLSGPVPANLTNLAIPIPTDFVSDPPSLPGFPNRLFLYSFEFTGNGCFSADAATTSWLDERDPRWRDGCNAAHITAPARNTTVAFPFTFSGTAEIEAASGVASVQIIVRNNDTLEHLQADGSLGAFTVLSADLDTAGAATSGWTYDAPSLPAGNYYVLARVTDGDGTSSVYERIDFYVAGDSTIPTVAFSTPLDDSSVVGGTIITGTADDAGSGVAEVHLIVRNLAPLNSHLQPDGSMGVWTILSATLDSPGSATTGWSYDASVLPTGTYYLLTRAVDGNGNPSDWSRIDITVTSGDVVAPTAVVETPANGESTTGGFSVSGSATDDASGVAAVQLVVRNLSTGEHLQGDGLLGVWSILTATLAAAGALDTAWTYDVAAPVGPYYILSRAIDGDGNASTWQRLDVTVTGGDTVDPEVTIDSPTDGDVVIGGTVISGTATDDASGVAAVQLIVRNLDPLNSHLQPDGSMGVWAILSATLTAPGTTNTGWSYDASTLPVGEYYILARAVDIDTNATLWSRVDITVTE